MTKRALLTSMVAVFGLTAVAWGAESVATRGLALGRPPLRTAVEAVSAQGSLELTAAVVTRDLQVRPLPKFRLHIRADGAESGVDLITGFDGAIATELAPGDYRVRSVEPLEWEREELTWDVPFSIVSGEVTRIELSRDNAQHRALGHAGRISPEAALYERLRPSVFLVSADAGVGTGFLVDTAGLVLTNYHVVAKARYIAVLVGSGRKVPAVQLAADTARDLAVLRVHPDAVAGLAPLSLLNDPAEVVVGERVLAIGNPLQQESVLTSGIVSKIDDDTLISDVNINPGNSGGPLLNLDGTVVGVNAFNLQARSGPGVSGTIRIHLAEAPLADARSAIDDAAPPPFDLLPTVPDTRFPPERLRAMLTATPDVSTYELAAGPFGVTFFTPPLLHSLSLGDDLRAAERQKKRIAKKQKKQKHGQAEESAVTSGDVELQDPSELIFNWAEESGVFDAVVIVRAVPEVKMTGGSKAGRIFGALAGVVTPATYRFKSDFREMRLLRDGQALRAIHPGRSCETVSLHGAYGNLEDVGCYGQYLYDPADFRTGSRFTLEIYPEDAPHEPEIVELGPALINRIRLDFVPYFDAVDAVSPSDSPDPREQDPPPAATP